MRAGNEPTLGWRALAPWLRWLVIISFALGAFLRLSDLDRKVFWYDETTTALHAAGYTIAETNSALSNAIHSVGEFQRFQTVARGSGIGKTISALARDDRQHPPAFYILENIQARVFGSSVASLRALSALIGILVLPAALWLCLELFKSALPSLVAVVLLAVSPFQVVYSHQAREYTLLTLLILISSALLLRALESDSKAMWGAYALAVSAGMYSSLFFALVLASHGGYLVALHGLKRKDLLARYAIAAAVGVISFAPWIIILLTSGKFISWGDTNITLKFMLVKWGFGVAAQFFDAEFADMRYLPVAIVFIALSAYSLYFVCRTASRRVSVFILALGGISLLALSARDLILGHFYSTVVHYLIPTWIAIQLAVAYTFAGQMANGVRLWPARLWKAGFALALALGLASCLVGNRAPIWYDNHDAENVPEIAAKLNAQSNPLVIADNIVRTLEFSHELRPEIRVLQRLPNSDPRIPVQGRPVFVLSAGQAFRNRIETTNHVSLKPIPLSSAAQTPISSFHAAVNRTQSAHNLKLTMYGDDQLWKVEQRQ